MLQNTHLVNLKLWNGSIAINLQYIWWWSYSNYANQDSEYDCIWFSRHCYRVLFHSVIYISSLISEMGTREPGLGFSFVLSYSVIPEVINKMDKWWEGRVLCAYTTMFVLLHIIIALCTYFLPWWSYLWPPPYPVCQTITLSRSLCHFLFPKPSTSCLYVSLFPSI